MKGALLTALITLLALLPASAFADAVLYISPEKGAYTLGQTFDVKVYADTGGKLINAAEGDVSYNTDALEVESVATDGSILTSWSTPPVFSNTDGTIRFAGWTKQNFSGVDGLLVTITFKALKSEVGTARLAAGAILAADGQESNIVTSMRSGSFTIVAPQAPADATDPNAADAASDADATSTDTAKVPAPVFDDVPDSVAIGDRIVMRGNTEANAKVSVYIARGSETEKRSDILSASDGSFTFVSDEPTVEGVYHVRASVITGDGRQSVPSDIVDITAAPAGAAATALFGASILYETLPFFALLVFAGLCAAYLWHRHQITKMRYFEESFFDQQ
jgi:hypothetical protein